MPINFFSENISFTLKKKKALKEWLTFASAKEKREIATINFIFCSDNYLLEINKKYLKHNYYTDIITFPTELHKTNANKNLKKYIAGDIYISVDRVKENAQKFGIAFDKELYRVLIHGTLHLIGYKDKNTVEKKKMTKKENFYLKLVENDL